MTVEFGYALDGEALELDASADAVADAGGCACPVCSEPCAAAGAAAADAADTDAGAVGVGIGAFAAAEAVSAAEVSAADAVVAGMVAGGTVACGRCRWPLQTGLLLGHPTGAEIAERDRALAAARRRFEREAARPAFTSIRSRGPITAFGAAVAEPADRSGPRAWLAVGGRDGSAAVLAVPEDSVEFGASEFGADVHHDSRVTAVAVDAGGTVVASGADDGSVVVRTSEPGRRAGMVTAHAGRVTGVRLAAGRPSRPTLFSLGRDGWLHRAAHDAGPGVHRFVQVGLSSCAALAISGDGSIAATGGADGAVRLWDGDTGARVGEVRVGAQIKAFDVDPTGTWLAVGAADGTVRVLDLRRITRLPDERAPAGPGPLVDDAAGPVSAIAVNSAGAVVTADDVGRIRRLPRGSGRAAVLLGTHGERVRVRGLLAGPDWVLSADADGEIRLWPTPADVSAAASGMPAGDG
jgi:WD40 repeat protein